MRVILLPRDKNCLFPMDKKNFQNFQSPNCMNSTTLDWQVTQRKENGASLPCCEASTLYLTNIAMINLMYSSFCFTVILLSCFYTIVSNIYYS